MSRAEEYERQEYHLGISNHLGVQKDLWLKKNLNKRTLWLYRLIFDVVFRNIVSLQFSMRNAQAQDLLVSFTIKQVIPSS